MYAFGRTVLLIGSAVMGLYSLLMLISAVFLAFTPEVTGWAAAIYIMLPILLLIGVLCSFAEPGMLAVLQKYALSLPLLALMYITYALPEYLTPLYASFRIWSGISIFGVFGGYAMSIIALIVLEGYLLYSFAMCIFAFGGLGFPLTRFICMNLYFMVFIPVAFIFDDVIKGLGTPEHYPRYLVFIAIIALCWMLSQWKANFPFHEISCQIYSYPVFIIVSYFTVFFFMSNWGHQGPDRILRWYGGLLEQHPWTIIFGIIACFIGWLIMTGRLTVSFTGSSSSGSSSSSSPSGKTGPEGWTDFQRWRFNTTGNPYN